MGSDRSLLIKLHALNNKGDVYSPLTLSNARVLQLVVWHVSRALSLVALH